METNNLENSSIRELRTFAKERGLRGYSKLNKDRLVDFIRQNTPAQMDTPAPEVSLLDTPVPEISAPVLEPEISPVLEPKTVVDVQERKRINDIAEWILNMPPTIKNKVLSLKDRAWEVIKNSILRLFPRLEPFVFIKSKSALGGFAEQYTIHGRPGYDEVTFLNAVREVVTKKLQNLRQSKVKLILKCIMTKTNIATGEQTVVEAPFHSNIETNLEGSDVNEMYDGMINRVKENFAAFVRLGSNWKLKSIVSLELHTAKYEPLRGGSYLPLPEKLASKHAIINLKNRDDECFKWAVTRALNPVEDHPERITGELRQQAEQYNWDGINFPTPLQDVKKFEKQNKDIIFTEQKEGEETRVYRGISVNVFGYQTREVEINEFKEYIYPRRISEQPGETRYIDLLLISNDKGMQHYCWIKNLSRLVSSQTSTDGHRQHFCRRCLNGFTSEDKLKSHFECCSNHEVVKITYPIKGSVEGFLQFKGTSRFMRVPFVVYADFEALVEPIETRHPDPCQSFTEPYQKHTPSSFCFYIKCFDDDVCPPTLVSFTMKNKVDNVGQIFNDTLDTHIKELCAKFKDKKTMIFSQDDRRVFNEATFCHICKKPFGDGEQAVKKVRDHCHLTGKFRGAAHNCCNINYKIPTFFPVILHNLSGYDSHLFIKQLWKNTRKDKSDITCIPNNEEKYISFTKKLVVGKKTDKDGVEKDDIRNLRFLDSYKFMPSSLDKLSKNLQPDQFKNLKKHFPNEKEFNLMRRKGVYPYDWVDSLEKLEHPALPPKEEFYSRLNNQHISDEDYQHAQRVWNTFKMKKFRDYHDLYNKCDVLILADIFENFRDVCMTNYDLDPAWYFTSPGLAWDAMLKITEIKLELLSDPDMVLMVEKGVRGGVATVSHRYGEANNPYMGDQYDETKPNKYLVYTDANNLYGWAMSQALPTDGFEWMSEEELTDWKKVCKYEGIGCILEVDLEYPDELHDLHNEYPLAPENTEVNKVPKLIPNLNNKSKYVIHYKNLQQYEQPGLRITKVHRGIKFNESEWLKKYIDLNTELRTKATNEFEKDFFKLMNNSVFGKTMENIRNRVDVRLRTSEQAAKKLAAKPNFHHCTIFDENLVAIHMKKTKIYFNKPVYLGMCILDLSKTLMYEFHYDYIKEKYGDKSKLLYTDTDSLTYEIETEDFYRDISLDVERWFDTSNIPSDHPSGIKSGINKKVPGKMKDELGGKTMTEFIGLRAKLYSYKTLDEEETKKCKGIKKSVIENTISHEDYKNCLFDRKEQRRKMNVIRSRGHEVYSEEVNKIALSSDDDKRVIMKDGIHTKAYGHYSLRK